MNRSLPEGTTSQMVDDQCGPDSFEVDDDVIRDAISRATVETNAEYMDGLHDIIKLAITPLLQVTIEKRVDEFLENYKVAGTFK